MRLVQTDHLQGGEVLAREILTSDYQVLLGEGTVMKPEYIEKLKDLNILSVYVKENYDHVKFEENTILKEEVKEDCLTKVREILQQHVYQKDTELYEINRAAEEVIVNILNDKHVIKKVYEVKTRSSDLYEHSLSVCSLAILMALKLNESKETVHEIGTASLLHDLGLLYITVDYNGRDISTLPKKEQEEYKKHTIYGYTAVLKEDWISERVKNMILHHHERTGGLGYPFHMKEVPAAYQILALCEAFDELLCGVGCVRVKVYEAIEYIKMQRDRGFDSEIVDTLLQFAAVYPTGTKVRLSNRQVGVVISQNENFPDRPNIKLIQDTEGRETSGGEIINLLKVLNLVITEVLD
ncbi:MAG: HD domain-containing protein [Lachnospiraceae bacterium]|nr:HD domain-containing protein [Lachnospiraceae bacterium]